MTRNSTDSDWSVSMPPTPSDSGISLPEDTETLCTKQKLEEVPSPWGRNRLFYFSLITFRVESQLFRVPREGFERNSEYFRRLFSEDRSGPGPHEGDSDDRPLHLLGATNEAFEYLLLILYPPHPTKTIHELQLSKEKWIGVLELAHKWKFNDIRHLAISELKGFCFDEVTKVELAHRFEIKEWLMEAYVALAKRPKPLSIHEAERLGFRFAVKMAHVRERRLERGPKHYDPSDMMLKVDITAYLEDEET